MTPALTPLVPRSTASSPSAVTRSALGRTRPAELRVRLHDHAIGVLSARCREGLFELREWEHHADERAKIDLAPSDDVGRVHEVVRLLSDRPRQPYFPVVERVRIDGDRRALRVHRGIARHGAP